MPLQLPAGGLRRPFTGQPPASFPALAYGNDIVISHASAQGETHVARFRAAGFSEEQILRLVDDHLRQYLVDAFGRAYGTAIPPRRNLSVHQAATALVLLPRNVGAGFVAAFFGSGRTRFARAMESALAYPCREASPTPRREARDGSPEGAAPSVAAGTEQWGDRSPPRAAAPAGGARGGGPGRAAASASAATVGPHLPSPAIRRPMPSASPPFSPPCRIPQAFGLGGPVGGAGHPHFGACSPRTWAAASTVTATTVSVPRPPAEDGPHASWLDAARRQQAGALDRGVPPHAAGAVSPAVLRREARAAAGDAVAEVVPAAIAAVDARAADVANGVLRAAAPQLQAEVRRAAGQAAHAEAAASTQAARTAVAALRQEVATHVPAHVARAVAGLRGEAHEAVVAARREALDAKATAAQAAALAQAAAATSQAEAESSAARAAAAVAHLEATVPATARAEAAALTAQLEANMGAVHASMRQELADAEAAAAEERREGLAQAKAEVEATARAVAATAAATASADSAAALSRAMDDVRAMVVDQSERVLRQVAERAEREASMTSRAMRAELRAAMPTVRGMIADAVMEARAHTAADAKQAAEAVVPSAVEAALRTMGFRPDPSSPPRGLARGRSPLRGGGGADPARAGSAPPRAGSPRPGAPPPPSVAETLGDALRAATERSRSTGRREASRESRSAREPAAEAGRAARRRKAAAECAARGARRRFRRTVRPAGQRSAGESIGDEDTASGPVDGSSTAGTSTRDFVVSRATTSVASGAERRRRQHARARRRADRTPVDERAAQRRARRQSRRAARRGGDDPGSSGDESSSSDSDPEWLPTVSEAEEDDEEEGTPSTVRAKTATPPSGARRRASPMRDARTRGARQTTLDAPIARAAERRARAASPLDERRARQPPTTSASREELLRQILALQRIAAERRPAQRDADAVTLSSAESGERAARREAVQTEPPRGEVAAVTRGGGDGARGDEAERVARAGRREAARAPDPDVGRRGGGGDTRGASASRAPGLRADRSPLRGGGARQPARARTDPALGDGAGGARSPSAPRSPRIASRERAARPAGARRGPSAPRAVVQVPSDPSSSPDHSSSSGTTESTTSTTADGDGGGDPFSRLGAGRGVTPAGGRGYRVPFRETDVPPVYVDVGSGAAGGERRNPYTAIAAALPPAVARGWAALHVWLREPTEWALHGVRFDTADAAERSLKRWDTHVTSVYRERRDEASARRAESVAMYMAAAARGDDAQVTAAVWRDCSELASALQNAGKTSGIRAQAQAQVLPPWYREAAARHRVGAIANDSAGGLNALIAEAVDRDVAGDDAGARRKAPGKGHPKPGGKAAPGGGGGGGGAGGMNAKQRRAAVRAATRAMPEAKRKQLEEALRGTSLRLAPA